MRTITGRFADFSAATEDALVYAAEAMYALGMERLHLKKDEIVFAAFGAWDAYGAKSFGYPTFWGEPLQCAGGRIGPEGRRHVQQFSGAVRFRAGKIGRVA